MRTFLQIIREAVIARKAGLSVFVALASTCSDDDWRVIWERLMKAAELEQSIKRRRPGQQR